MMKHLLLVLLSCTACEGITSPPEPVVSVLKRTDAGCFALMTPASPVSTALGVAPPCDQPAAPWFYAGLDLVEVVVDYGPDVDFADTTQAPPPVISLSIDGMATDLAIDLTSGRAHSRAYFVGTFRAPAQISSDIRVAARVAAGFETSVPVEFQTVQPPVAIELAECPSGLGCELPGGVGSAHYLISVLGDVPQTVKIHATLDGTIQPDPVPPVTTALIQTDNEATVAIPIPAARDGAVWAVSAQLGDKLPSVSATIRAPEISAQLSCGDACAVTPGQAIGLEITAPAQLVPQQAIVDTRIDGVPQIVAAPVALVANADGTSTGLLALDAPSQGGTWEIDASVAGYAAPALLATVQ